MPSSLYGAVPSLIEYHLPKMINREIFVQQVAKELQRESERGCILVAAGVLDESLEEILKASLTADTHGVRYAVTPLFEGMGPLATFSAKIKLAYGLGLISRVDFSDLEKIRRIRNVAAHQYSTITFDMHEIADIARTLESADLAVKWGEKHHPKHEVEPRPQATGKHARMSKEHGRFIMSVSFLLGRLSVMYEYLKRGDVRVALARPSVEA